MGFRQVCKEAGTERPSSSVLFGLPQSPGRALPFCFSGQLPGPVCSGGKLRSPGMGAPPVRVLLLDVSRETPRKSLPRGSKPQEGNVQGASQSGALQHHRPPRTCVLHTADHLPRCAGRRVQGAQGGLDRGRRGSDALPQGKFLPLGASLSRGGRPGSGA